MAQPEPRQSRYRELGADAHAMLAAGESGRFEFKRDAEAVKPATLTTLANWVALTDGIDVAHILVGVDEVADDATGLVGPISRGRRQRHQLRPLDSRDDGARSSKGR